MEDFLKGLPLFQEFSREKLSRLIAESRAERYAPGEVIIEFGQPGRFLGIVLEGRAEAVVDDPETGKKRLGGINRGDFFGEMSLMTGEPTSANVVAEESCRVLLIPQETFAEHLVTNPSAVRLIAKTISDRLRNREQNGEARTRLEGAWRKHPDPYGLSLETTKPMKLCWSSTAAAPPSNIIFSPPRIRRKMRAAWWNGSANPDAFTDIFRPGASSGLRWKMGTTGRPSRPWCRRSAIRSTG